MATRSRQPSGDSPTGVERDCAASKAFVYSPGYDLPWAGHIFPVEKYRLTRERIIAEGIARPEEFLEPGPAAREDIERVHSRAYLDELERLASAGLGAESVFEAPLTPAVLDAVILAAGGTTLACRKALRHNEPRTAITMNLAGGYHHAFRDHGEGFCFLNDVAVAVASVLAEGLALRVMVVDCDVHQGNGTASIFRNEERVFTLDVHQEDLYPVPKERASLDIGLLSGAGDEEYLRLLEGALSEHVPRFAPDLVLYVAGADPFAGDQLGSLALSKGGFARRDELVFRAAREVDAAVAIVLAGGYPADVRDAVDVHVQTARAMRA